MKMLSTMGQVGRRTERIRLTVRKPGSEARAVEVTDHVRKRAKMLATPKKLEIEIQYEAVQGFLKKVEATPSSGQRQLKFQLAVVDRFIDREIICQFASSLAEQIGAHVGKHISVEGPVSIYPGGKRFVMDVVAFHLLPDAIPLEKVHEAGLMVPDALDALTFIRQCRGLE